MTAISLVVAAGVTALAFVLPRRQVRLRASRAGWRTIERTRVPVQSTPMGAYRDAGTIALRHADTPRAVRAAATLATITAACFALLGVSAASYFAEHYGEHWPTALAAAAALALAVVSISAAFIVDRAGAALLRLERASAWRARDASIAAAASLVVMAIASALSWPPPSALYRDDGVSVLTGCLASGAALLAAALLVRAVAARYRHALNLV